MSVIPFKGQKVAGAFAHLDPNKALGEGIVAGGFPIINFRGKIWSLLFQGEKHLFRREDDGTQLSYLDVIIVGHPAFIAKTYYPNTGEGYDEDNTNPPVCASVRGDRPDPGVPEPQNALCGTCSHNAWKTLPNGRRGKECQDHKKLAILLMPKMTKQMMGSPLLEPAYLKVPPGSLTALKMYGEELRHNGFPFCSVITRVSFSPDKLFQMNFEFVQALTDAEAPLVLPMLEDPRTHRITGEGPEIREVKQVAKREVVDTGLLEAYTDEPAPPTRKPVYDKIEREISKSPLLGAGYGAEPEVDPTPKKRGRPAKPKQLDLEEAIDEAKPLPPLETKWDDETTDLDREVADLLGNKINNMLK